MLEFQNNNKEEEPEGGRQQKVENLHSIHHPPDTEELNKPLEYKLCAGLQI